MILIGRSVMSADAPLQMLPEIRTDLFGKNPNRRFYNVRMPSRTFNGS